MASWTKPLLAMLTPALAAVAHAEGLAFRWATEVSRALPYDAQAFQGETFALEARLVQYGQPMAGAATAKFYYQTKNMAAHEWYTAPAAWDAATGAVSAAWDAAMDVGATAYRWFFGVDMAEGKNYRVYGTLRLKPSPGFNPAELVPEDVRQELIDAITADLQAWAEGRFLSAERIDQTLDAPAADRVPSSALLDGQLAAKANKTHTHRISEVTLLQSALDKKADADDLDLKADKTHTHTQAQVSGLSAALAAKANATHTHTTAAITDLYATLNPLYAAKGHDHTLENIGVEIRQELLSKAPMSHTHAQAQIEGLTEALGTYLTKTLAATTYQPKGAYLTAETDPTVPAWAKAAAKPAYTAAEVGAAPANHNHDATYLKLSGGTLTGALSTKGVTFGGDVVGTAWTLKMGYVESASAPRTANGVLRKADGDAAYSPKLVAGENIAITNRVVSLSFPRGKPIAIGDGAEGHDGNSVAIGHGAMAAVGGVAIGDGAKAINDGAVAIGVDSSADQDGVAIGPFSHAGMDEIMLSTGNSQIGLTRAKGLKVYDDTYWPQDDEMGLTAAKIKRLVETDPAPLSAVSMATNGVTYIWVWDPKAGCHALTKNGEEPNYAD